MNTPDTEHPESRARVLRVLMAATAPLSTTELCARANTTAAPRRAWELQKFYGYKLLLTKHGRNQWTWEYLGAEPWAVDPSATVREAKTAKRDAVTPKPVPPVEEWSLTA